MQTIKKRAAPGPVPPVCLPRRCPRRAGWWARVAAGSLAGRVRFGGVLLALVALVGCAPPGPRAVLEGKRLLDRGEYAPALEELRTAVELMPTNALAFSYLGLACHEMGQPAEAERAYLRALALDHDLTEVHYNLGCLWLAQPNKLEQAKAQFITFNLRRPNSPEGWLKLGQVQLRTRELTAAEKSLDEALRLDPQNPEVLTELGVLRHQRRRSAEAAQFFNKALKVQPDYRPALLNLAVVAQEELNQPQLALQEYRQYLALKPVPENAPAVSVLVRQLEQELNPPPRQPASGSLPAPVHTNPVAQKTVVAEVSHGPAPAKEPTSNLVHPASVAKAETPTNAARTIPAAVAKPVPVNNPAPPEHIELVKVGADPEIKPAEDVSGPLTSPRVAEPEMHRAAPTLAEATDPRPQKRSFLQRINPINLFTRDDKPAGTQVSTPSVGSYPGGTTLAATPGPAVNTAGNASKFPRYAYRSPAAPAAGDRDLAQRPFAQGVQEQQARRFPEAIQDYRRAAQLDPGFFDAHYNLGLAASENGNLALALAAYETALAIRPDSLDARYNFGLVLKQAGYVTDAMTEFERILGKNPNDARTHLALGNLYAQQLQEPAKARQQYLAVLAVAPQSPQANAIRYWLTDHPK